MPRVLGFFVFLTQVSSQTCLFLANKITPTFHIQISIIRKDFSLHLKLKSRNKLKIDEKVGNNAFDPNFIFSQFHPFQRFLQTFSTHLKILHQFHLYVSS